MASATSTHYGPDSIESGLLLIDALRAQPGRQSELLRLSVHQWDRHACGTFARAAKQSALWSERNALGDQLRSLANLAILREHQLAHR
jgi:GrpB-like predicted nucleotidyltransferase (UPF0157 family)